MENTNKIKVGMAQISPVWLSKAETLEKVKASIKQAGAENCDLVVFGESILPGYPFWLSLLQGAKFNSKVNKELHAHYLRNSIQIEAGDLNDVCALAGENSTAVYLGIAERPADRGGHSLYCSLVYINKKGEIKSVHRKIQPTYEERLTWSAGDGNGLQVHPLNGFNLGGLNCWENWVPLARTALYGLGENLHVAVWPGGVSLTQDITRFIAKESRSFVVSVSGLMRKTDFPEGTPHLEKILDKAPDILADGGSCIAGPDGEWIIEPIGEKEGLFTATLDLDMVLEERQNFDLAGHYSRPDITKLTINRTRQSILNFDDMIYPKS